VRTPQRLLLLHISHWSKSKLASESSCLQQVNRDCYDSFRLRNRAVSPVAIKSVQKKIKKSTDRTTD